MSSALCCSDLDVAELAQPRERVVEAAGGHAQDERGGRAPVAGGDLRGLHEAPGRLRGAHDAVAGLLHVGRGQLEARAALDAALPGGRRAGAAPRELLPAPAAAAAAALRGVRGLAPGRASGAAVPPPPPLLALSFELPPPASARPRRWRRGRSRRRRGRAPAGAAAGSAACGSARWRSRARRARSRRARNVGRHRRRLGAHVAHERGELGLGGGIAGEGGLERFELGGHGGIEGGLMTAHGRPPAVGRGRGARGCPRWRARRRGRRRSRRCSVPRGTSGR